MRVTMLGTGIMGAGMVRSMLRAGLTVTVWNRDTAKSQALAADGATVAGDPAAAVADAEVVVTMLFDTDAVVSVMEVAAPAMAADAVWVQTSTVGVQGASVLADLAVRYGVDLLDAPVLGTRTPAEKGALIVLTGGPDALVDRAAPVLEAIGARTVRVGAEAGAGSRLKLALNAWILMLTAGTAQSLALASALGVDPALVLSTIDGGATDSPYAQLKGASMLAGDFAPSFALSGAGKDAGLITAALESADLDPSLLQAVSAMIARAEDRGHGADDMAAIYRGLPR